MIFKCLNKKHFNYKMFPCFLVIIMIMPINFLDADPEMLLTSTTTTDQQQSRDSPLLRSRKRISDHSIENLRNENIGSSLIMVPMVNIQNNNQDLITDRVRMSLECRPKSMLMSMNFSEPFRGVVSVGKSTYNSFEQNQECALRGDGRRLYSLQIFHNRCLTRFDKKHGQFINTLFVRYHPTLETGGDYSKTLLCKFSLANFSVN
ncbi:uncharacterized protein LOC113798768 [Dermatophagoides pteronyssinus]|uniref:uncharacterized protein LOC113798768 n=1 Tax=Dermatophagoides pteronyssinus TaxID=6956 RepID=UPI003F67E588